MEYHYVADPVSDGEQFLRLVGFRLLYRFGCSFADDRFFLCRVDLSVGGILSAGIDALVLEDVAFSDPGCPGNVGVCQIEFDGRFHSRDPYGICHFMGSMLRLLCAGMPGIPV